MMDLRLAWILQKIHDLHIDTSVCGTNRSYILPSQNLSKIQVNISEESQQETSTVQIGQ